MVFSLVQWFYSLVSRNNFMESLQHLYWKENYIENLDILVNIIEAETSTKQRYFLVTKLFLPTGYSFPSVWITHSLACNGHGYNYTIDWFSDYINVVRLLLQ